MYIPHDSFTVEAERGRQLLYIDESAADIL